MRIAHVTATFPPYYGGAGTVCFHNARELAKLAHDVHVFTAALRNVPALEVQDGFTVHRLPPLVQVGNAALLRGLFRALRGFDIIHLHCPFVLGAEIVSLAAAVNGARLVVTYHNDLVRPGTWRDVAFRLATWSSRVVVLNRADRVLFVSQGHAETSDQHTVYSRRGPHCQILPNGVDIQAFYPQVDGLQVRTALRLPLQAHVVGFVATLDSAHHYKGLNILLAALATQALTGTYLLVVGDGDMKEKYLQQAHHLGLAERVLFYGATSHTDLPSLYRACDVVAMPSLAPESFGLVAIEALACGVPVVASDGPGVRSVLQHRIQGFLVEPGNVPALAEALRQVLQDDEARRVMGSRGRARVEECYDWTRLGLRLEGIYQDVMNDLKKQSQITGQTEP